MRPRESGHIVNIASAAGKAGFPGGATYCATKHGVVGLSEAVRAELRGSGVEISVVMPAIVRTELAAGLKEARFFKSVEATDVADAIVKTLQRPKFEVYVPRLARRDVPLHPPAAPRASPSGSSARSRATRSSSTPSPDARTDYEARAAASAPGRPTGRSPDEARVAHRRPARQPARPRQPPSPARPTRRPPCSPAASSPRCPSPPSPTCTPRSSGPPARSGQWAAHPARRAARRSSSASTTCCCANARPSLDLIQAETGKARRDAFEELCEPALVTSYYLRTAPKLLRPQAAGPACCPARSPPRSCAAEGRRRHHLAVELPVRARARRPHPGAHRRQRRGPQAGQPDRAEPAVRRRPALPGGPAGGPAAGRARRRPDDRRRGRRHLRLHRLHRLHPHRHADRRAGRRAAHRLLAGARRQEPDDRARRRGRSPRPRRSRRARVLRQRRPAVPLDRTDLRARLDLRRVRRARSSPRPARCALASRVTTTAPTWAR